MALPVAFTLVNVTEELVDVTPRADTIAIRLWIAFAVRWGPATPAGAGEVPRPPPVGGR